MKYIGNCLFILVVLISSSKIDILKNSEQGKLKLNRINEEVLFFDKVGKVKKDILYDDYKKEINSFLKNKYYTFAVTKNGTVYCVDEDGIIVTGFVKIDGDTYYFDEKGIMQKGFVKINSKSYLFDEVSGKLKYGFYTDEGNNSYYINQDGTMAIGFTNIENNTYYFNEMGVMQKGVISIEGQKYLFDWDNGKLQYGMISSVFGTYYTNNFGIIQTGIQDINGNKYYFDETGIMQKGWITIENQKYYFNDYGAMVTSTITIGNKEYYFNMSGVLEYERNIPVYYSQKDYRWADISYGLSNMYASGCGPTSLAMILSSLLDRNILPTEVAGYLYNYTNEFNKDAIGMSGLAVHYVAGRYGVKITGITSLEMLKSELSQGKIIIGFVGPSHFVRPGYTHAIVLFGNPDNITVYNPNPTYNGSVQKTSPEVVWYEQSTDAYDYKGGYLFYSFN